MPRGTTSVMLLGLALTAAACGGVAAAAKTVDTGKPGGADHAPSSTGVPTSPDGAQEARRDGPAHLGVDARFADLIAAARGLRAGDDPGAGCLLARSSDGAYALGVAPAPATSTWPQPGAPSAAPAAARVLTPWGVVGEGDDGQLWMSFTPLPASATRNPGLLLHLGGDRVHVRRTDRELAMPAVDVDGAALAVVEARAEAPVSVYVTATAETSIAVLFSLLHRLPVDTPVALAIALPDGSTLPPPAMPSSVPARCPDGLPDPAADAAEGELPRQALLAAVAPLGDGARACFTSAVGGAAAGGRVVLAIRVGSGGTVDEACIVSATLGDPILDTCIAETARLLRFDTPSPAGFVDVHLPLQLSPIEHAAPRAVCGP